MIRNTNPFGGAVDNVNNNYNRNGGGGGGGGGGRASNGSGGGANSVQNTLLCKTLSALKHNSGVSTVWTREEDSTLKEMLAKYTSGALYVRYAGIGIELQSKTVREIALRCRWLSDKENRKQRKEYHDPMKSKDKKLKVTDCAPRSQVTNRTNYPPLASSIMPVNTNGDILNDAIGGATGQLLEQSAKALDQICANFSSCKVHENINLFSQTRNNIISILQHVNDNDNMPEIMKQMPPVPVKVNEALAHAICSLGL